ncbi:MAG TPA: hypothetical protein VFO70_00385, partial [Chitinophagaceae bacterium]|nr:hypothetical protein [Chitinophagaceae bacterium]
LRLYFNFTAPQQRISMKCKTTFHTLLLLHAIFFLSINVNAQDRSLTNLEPFQPQFLSFDAVLNLTGTMVNKNGVDENGLLYPYWSKGIVNFNNGKQLREVELQFNLVKNELYFNNNNRPNRFADSVKTFFIVDTSNGVSRVATFNNGYPGWGEQTRNTYYLVLTSGPSLHLLKYIVKKKREVYEYGSASKTVYDLEEEMVVYDVKNNSIKRIRNTTASLTKALPDHAAIIQQFLKDRKGKQLTDAEIMEITRQINMKPA